jgi:hypothetical protein
MKALNTALAIAALITAPAFTSAAVAAQQSQNDVIVGGKTIGSDPDANVRFQLRRDFGSEGF